MKRAVHALFDYLRRWFGFRRAPRKLRPFFSYVRMRPRMQGIYCAKAMAYDDLMQLVGILVSRLPADQHARPLSALLEINYRSHGALQ